VSTRLVEPAAEAPVGRRRIAPFIGEGAPGGSAPRCAAAPGAAEMAITP